MKNLSILLNDNDKALFPILAIAEAVGLFFALRELMLWYWRINETLKEQQQTNRLLSALLEHHGAKLPVTPNPKSKEEKQ